MTTSRRLLDSALVRLAGVGAEPGDDEETRLRKALLVLIAILILPIAGTWAALYLAFGAWTGWFAAVYAAISIGAIVLFTRTRDFNQDHARCLALLALDMVAATRADGIVADLDLELRIGINSGPSSRASSAASGSCTTCGAMR